MKFQTKQLLAIGIISVAVLVSGTVLVKAQDASGTSAAASSTVQSITFPIPELGNCADRDACRAYCSQTANLSACISYAKAHGLMNKEEGDRAEKFRDSLEKGQTPGGCTSPESCKSFCENIANIAVCTKFAEDHGVNAKDVEQGKKLGEFLKAGGQTPGNCTSRESCASYCEDFNHAAECQNFAEKAGLRVSGGPGGEQFKKLQELLQAGQTPGGCTSKDQCEAYCKDSTHLTECVSFAQAIGALKADDAEKIKKLGGKGPGGCSSEESCAAYCNQDAHHAECLQFAKDNNLIKPEDLKKSQEGMASLRSGLEQAPPQVQSCLNSVLGVDTISKIEAGTLLPNADLGDNVRGCFEKFGRSGKSMDMLKNAPPAVTSCLQNKLGAGLNDLLSGSTTPTGDVADSIRVCFQSSELEKHGFGTSSDDRGEGGSGFLRFLNNAPSGLAACLKAKLGDKFGDLQSGNVTSTSDVKDQVQSCLQQFKPSSGDQGESGRRLVPSSTEINIPGWMMTCLKSRGRNDELDKLQKGEISTGDIKDLVQGCIGGGPAMPVQPPSSMMTPNGGMWANLPGSVQTCLKGNLSPDVLSKLLQGETSGGDISSAIRKCYPGSGAPNITPNIPNGMMPPFQQGQTPPPQGSSGEGEQPNR